MGSSLSQKAERYRQLSEMLSNPEDVASAHELAIQLDNIGKLEVQEDSDKRVDENAAWLVQALSRVFELNHNNPVILEILFCEVLSSKCDQSPQEDE